VTDIEEQLKELKDEERSKKKEEPKEIQLRLF